LRDYRPTTERENDLFGVTPELRRRPHFVAHTWPLMAQKYENGAKTRMENNKYKQTVQGELVREIYYKQSLAANSLA
jgi:hypothetical protein